MSSYRNTSRRVRRGGGFNNRGQSYGGNRGRYGGRRRGFAKPKNRLDRSLFINDNVKINTDTDGYSGKLYSEFNFTQTLARNLQQKGFKECTEIQDKTIPLILEGKDVLGFSKTGSGKTGAFLIPLIQKLLTSPNQKLLVIAPTRELAQQISKEAVSMVKGNNLYVALVVGGESMGKQISQLRRGGEIIIGTPGRLKDLINRDILKPYDINNVVLDEVDRMLDMGFIDDVNFIFNKLSKSRQSLFFSATSNEKIERIVRGLTASYETVRLNNNTPNDSVVQSVIDYSHTSEKIERLEEILNREDVAKALIFVDTKRFADQIEKILSEKQFKVAAIHGDKRQNKRRQVIDMFRNSRVKYLVATNVAARGIDIDDITHVINFDEPTDYDEYIHRIGRTGRNGGVGTAYTFVRR